MKYMGNYTVSLKKIEVQVKITSPLNTLVLNTYIFWDYNNSGMHYK